MNHVRFMTKDDLEQTAALEKEIFSMPWSKQAFLESLESDNTIYLVAEENQGIAGYCGMYCSFEEGNITNVAVSPKYRRRKIAETMINKILVAAKEKGITDVILEVRETNVAAIKLYEKLGFEEAGIRKNFYAKPMENALIMWKHNL